jgi:hypothetical protein
VSRESRDILQGLSDSILFGFGPNKLQASFQLASSTIRDLECQGNTSVLAAIGSYVRDSTAADGPQVHRCDSAQTVCRCPMLLRCESGGIRLRL